MSKVLAWIANRRFNIFDAIWISVGADALSKGHFFLWIAIILGGATVSVAMENLSQRMEKAS